MSEPQPVDPEIAAATLNLHLTQFFEHGRGSGAGWERFNVDPLHAVVRIPATRVDGTQDHYFLRIGAEYYDVWPPRAEFVRPAEEGGWADPTSTSRWWPRQQNQPGFSFGLDHDRHYPDGSTRQLLCFSHSFDYYITGHNPTEDERWRQGTHTVSATLNRVATVLTAPNYQGPSGDNDT
jgi:hypothetical protein